MFGMVWFQRFCFPAKCSAFQHRRLTGLFGMCCEVYNVCLESWRGMYLWWREHHPDGPLPWGLQQTFFDRARMFTDLRGDLPEWGAVSVKVGCGVLKRFDRASGAFY